MTKQSKIPETYITKRLREFSRIRELYETRMKKDFAPDELKPLASMRRSWNKGTYDCYGLFEGEEILGYAFYVRLGNTYLLDYLAVEEKHRNQGLGSVFLQQLNVIFANADCVICEVEDPDMAEDEKTREQRERRLEFYLRGGYQRTAVTSVVFGVHYRLLVISENSFTAQQLCTAYSELYRSTLPSVFFHTCFRTDVD